MGACAQELYDLGHRENFFYLQHAMGLASSIGLGLALHLPHEKIVVLDGDGSVLMNLGTLATLARYRPRNLVHFIFDNGSLLSTGGFDSHTTSGITDLAAIARGAGIEHVAAVDSVMAFGEAAIEAFARNDLSVIVAKVAAVGPNHYGMDLAAGKRVSIQTVDRREEVCGAARPRGLEAVAQGQPLVANASGASGHAIGARREAAREQHVSGLVRGAKPL